MLEIIRGESKNRRQGETLAQQLQADGIEGDLYLGYPVLSTPSSRVQVDALLVSERNGVVAFQVDSGVPTDDEEWQTSVASQNQLFAVLESQLRRYDNLRAGRKLAFDVNTITVFGASPGVLPPIASADDGIYCGLDDVSTRVGELTGIDHDLFMAVQSALQRVSTIQPQNRRSSVKSDSSRGAKVKKIERSIANLDHWQNRAAIEMPEGPQRIRGLAGSGKTIVLALKAAYLHAQHPDWNIAVTFESRALYQQFEALILRFTLDHLSESPDFEKLRIMHAWGSSNRQGVYKTIASHMGVPYRDFNYGSAKYGRDNAFKGICEELLALAESGNYDVPIFDAVLIDEAQDMPPEFFRLVYHFTKEPKRIVWGYDELQKLSESSMPSMEEMFGVTSTGDPRVTLAHGTHEAKRDIVLPTCYRNTPWSLAIAHSLGYGVYRDGGLVQHFDDPKLWTEVGYKKVSGDLRLGRRVVLERSPDSTPDFFPELLRDDDAVLVKQFSSEVQQDEWVAEQIQINLEADELEPTDILVVFPVPFTARSRALKLRTSLARRGISSHLVGVNSSVDELRVAGSVAMAHIYRAKGNEAPMVYVMDAHQAALETDRVTRRNTIFTAITRNKAWVRITGHGVGMEVIRQEIQEVRDHRYQLDFTIPSRSKLDRLRRNLQGRSKEELEQLQATEENLRQFVEALDAGLFDLDDVPSSLRAQVASRLQPRLDIGDIVDDA